MKYDFKIAGCLGDIIWALPTIRELGGGSLCVCPSAAWLNNEMQSANQAAGAHEFEQLRELLGWSAGYVKGFEVSEQEEEARYDLNEFRGRAMELCGPKNLPQHILETFGCNPRAWQEPWLVAPPATRNTIGYPVVIHRTLRYHNPAFDWRALVDKYSPDCVFVGRSEEHALFCEQAGFLPWRMTATLLQLAQEIADCALFAGNQSVGYAIAEALKHRAILEKCPQTNNHNFERDTVQVDPSPEQLPDWTNL